LCQVTDLQVEEKLGFGEDLYQGTTHDFRGCEKTQFPGNLSEGAQL